MQQALQTLELMAQQAGLVFDRMLAERALTEAERGLPGDDSRSWVRRLVQAGETLGLRLHSIECSLSQGLDTVRQGLPLAACISETGGERDWILIREASTWRVRVAGEGTDLTDHWITIGQLRKKLGISSMAQECHWVMSQRALACEAASSSLRPDMPGDHADLSPLARLLKLIRPELKDLWMVVVFSLLIGVLALASPIAVEALVNTVAFGRYLQPVVVLAILLFTFLAFAAAARGLITYIVEVLQRRVFVRVIDDLAYRLPRVEQQALDREHGPELLNRFFDVVTVQKAASALLLDGVAIVLQTIIGMAVLAFYHPFLLGFDVVLIFLIGILVLGLGRGAVRTAVKESKAKYAVAEWLEDIARHSKAFKQHGGNQLALARADQLAANWIEQRRHHFRIVLRQILFAMGMQVLANTALLGLGGWLVIQGELTLGQLVASELIVMMIVSSFAKSGKYMESFYDLLAAVDKLGHLFDLPVERQDRLYHLDGSNPAEVRAANVSYHYGEMPGLSSISLKLMPGQMTALTGPTGSGKSTLIDLFSGIRTPSTGHIQLNGIDLRELHSESRRECIGVARLVEIFRGTIGENIHLNQPHISAADVRDALQAVGLLEELSALPAGLNSQLQTHGAPLSHSQQLRLMLARAIVGRPQLLLIDGTLDALADAEIAEVLAGIRNHLASQTMLIATGRRDLAQRCDQEIALRSIVRGELRQDQDGLTSFSG